MAESSISVAIRIRPFSSKESAQLAPNTDYQPFLGDGGLSAGSGSTQKLINGTGPGLRSKYLRSIVSAVDDKVLIFDPPELRSSTSTASQNTFAHGTRKPRDVRYAFDRVFDDTCSQEMVFENTTKPLLDGILNGFNASVFAYGATGCGKTHTISGTAQDPGVIFLTMRELYRRIEESRDQCEVNVRLSYLEIYNEQIRDLLSPTPTPPGSGLMLREDAANKISVMGITEHTPESPESVLEMIQEGNLRRTMSPTEANAVSSRSHAVLQINVMQRPRTADTVMETTSASLNIIDLAGSERAAATRNDGARMKEGANINKSLLALGNCINALCQSAGQKSRHIPYRNSKLTRLLKFSLGGNCKTVMIVCVSPSSAHYDETYNTLKYANQAKNIRTKVSRNMLNVDRHVAQYVQAIHALKEEVAELKAKLADRVAVESLGEKRRKVEMVREMDEVKVRMQSSTADLKNTIAPKAAMQALLLAATVRLSALRQRLQQLESDTGADNTSPDVTCEQQVLRKLAARQEAILADRTMQGEAQNLVNAMQAHKAGMLAASNNVKFDEEATRSMRVVADQMVAEVESCKAQAIADTFSKQLGASMANLADFAVLGARSTIALKEVADATAAVDNGGASKEEIGDHLRALAKSNDDLFASHVGMQTIDMAARGTKTIVREPRPSVLRRARSSVIIQAPTTSHPPLATAARLAKRMSRTSLLQTSAPIVSNPLQLSKTARRPSASIRRSSMGARRVSSSTSSRRSVQAGSTVAAPPEPRLSTAPAPIAKKAFRWADEAGEGKIDDNTSSSIDTSLTKPRASTGPSQNIRTSLSSSLVVQSNIVSGAEAVSSVTNSSNEWEDDAKDSSNDFAVAPIRTPLATSTTLNSTQPDVNVEPVKTRKREANASIFKRNFLRKKQSDVPGDVCAHGSDSLEAMETDDSVDDEILTPQGGSEKGDDSLLSGASKHPFSSAVRSSPYRRPSATILDATKQAANGIGPIRTKSRSSGSLESPMRKSVASLAASINSRSAPTTNYGPK